MRKIANAIDKAPKVIAAKTTEFELGVKANGEKERGGPKDQNRDKNPRHRSARDLERDQEPRLFDHAGVGVRRRKRRLLGVGFGLQRAKIVGERLGALQRPLDREHGRIDLAAAPDRRVGLLDALLEPVAHWLGLGPELSERLIEPEDLG